MHGRRPLANGAREARRVAVVPVNAVVGIMVMVAAGAAMTTTITMITKGIRGMMMIVRRRRRVMIFRLRHMFLELWDGTEMKRWRSANSTTAKFGMKPHALMARVSETVLVAVNTAKLIGPHGVIKIILSTGSILWK